VETISFARGAPAPELLPAAELADCVDSVLGREGRTILSYGAGAGYTPLRELIGEWFEVHPGRVVLTNGGLQGLELLTRRLARGRSVVCELPTYDRAYKVFLDAPALRKTLYARSYVGSSHTTERPRASLRVSSSRPCRPPFVKIGRAHV